MISCPLKLKYGFLWLTALNATRHVCVSLCSKKQGSQHAELGWVCKWWVSDHKAGEEHACPGSHCEDFHTIPICQPQLYLKTWILVWTTERIVGVRANMSVGMSFGKPFIKTGGTGSQVQGGGRGREERKRSKVRYSLKVATAICWLDVDVEKYEEPRRKYNDITRITEQIGWL